MDNPLLYMFMVERRKGVCPEWSIAGKIGLEGKCVCW
jgi:hypothetical protein